ncbi:uncharacterized protein ANIA_11171 [Aspergillus nidulans FGSC A4]|uniref:Uncharacterized protein n=1 Tax=Emericella nidulans (strain FGSC A4 / ATCC 38163 / CBS 112.46 / NRRL 194 / M139) TaxID=227321 RepID=C8VK39_EMENI|nr:hypothetical protein [Aspergillus nidulans FGSC A4]CBF82431.1 TPA: hypothetical protein ANIA_11171 [Aspergillus nidulans FGSC A4]
MATTTTTASATSTCAPKLYEIPTHDAACAMPNSNSSYADLMSSCCGTASVISYSNCDYYCLAQNQTVGELAECLIKGSRAGEVWCNTNASATATGTATVTTTSSTSENGSHNASETGETADPTETSAGAVKMVASFDAHVSGEQRDIDLNIDTIKLTTKYS